MTEYLHVSDRGNSQRGWNWEQKGILRQKKIVYFSLKKTCCTISAVNVFSYIPKKTKGSIILYQQYINILRGKKESDKNYVHIILSRL